MKLPKIDFKNITARLNPTDRSFGKGGMPLALKMAALVAVAVGNGGGQGMVDPNAPTTPTGAPPAPRG